MKTSDVSILDLLMFRYQVESGMNNGTVLSQSFLAHIKKLDNLLDKEINKLLEGGEKEETQKRPRGRPPKQTVKVFNP